MRFHFLGSELPSAVSIDPPQDALPVEEAASGAPRYAFLPVGGSISGSTIDSSTTGSEHYAGGYSAEEFCEMCWRVKVWDVDISYTLGAVDITRTGTLSPNGFCVTEQDIVNYGFSWSGLLEDSVYGDGPCSLRLMHFAEESEGTDPVRPYYYHDPETGYFQPRLYFIADGSPTIYNNPDINDEVQASCVFFGREFPVWMSDAFGAITDFTMTITPSEWWPYRTDGGGAETRIWDEDTGEQLQDHRNTEM